MAYNPNGCTKRCFRDENAARSAGTLACIEHSRAIMWPYKCPRCTAWHLTSMENKNCQPITQDYTQMGDFTIGNPRTTAPQFGSPGMIPSIRNAFIATKIELEQLGATQNA